MGSVKLVSSLDPSHETMEMGHWFYMAFLQASGKGPAVTDCDK